MLLKNILVPLDGSPLSERALPYAAELARAAGASLTLVCAADVHPRLHLLGLSHLLPEDPSRSLNIHAYRLRAQGLVVHGDDVPVVLVHPQIAQSAPELDKTPAMFARGER